MKCFEFEAQGAKDWVAAKDLESAMACMEDLHGEEVRDPAQCSVKELTEEEMLKIELIDLEYEGEDEPPTNNLVEILKTVEPDVDAQHIGGSEY